MVENADNTNTGADNTLDNTTENTEENKAVQFGCRVDPADKAWFQHFQRQFSNGKEAFAALVNGYKGIENSIKPNENAVIKEVIKEVEVIKEIPMSVQAPDFICKPTIQIAENMRRIRKPFYEKRLTLNENKEEYPNELAKYAIRYLLHNEFKTYIQ